MRLRTLSIPLAISFLIVACVPVEEKEARPTPERSCSTTLNWHGIIPGRSTQQDVINALGTPPKTGTERFDQSDVTFYAYPVDGGVVAQFAKDRIFFGSDGIVDWLEVTIADRDGEFHAVRDMLDDLSNTLDTVYWNNNYRPASRQFDVIAGPDQVYVWSECGLALNATGHCSSSEADRVLCPQRGEQTGSVNPISLVLRYPNPFPQFSREPNPSVDNAVLMMFLFPPTSYEGFTKFYMQKIPFGLWYDFFQEIRSDN